VNKLILPPVTNWGCKNELIGYIATVWCIQSFILWHTPKSIAMLTTSHRCTLLDALCQAEFSSEFSGLMSFSKVHSQEVAGWPRCCFHSGGGLHSAAVTALWWSSQTRWPKYCSCLYLTKSSCASQPVLCITFALAMCLLFGMLKILLRDHMLKKLSLVQRLFVSDQDWLPYINTWMMCAA